jgi:hypothetical protein
MEETMSKRRRLLLAGGLAAGLAAAVLAMRSGSPVNDGAIGAKAGSPAQARSASHLAHAGATAPHQVAAMPAAPERIDALVAESGVPAEAREALVALGGDIARLRAREQNRAQSHEERDALSAERRAVSDRTRKVLEALPARYRAAMRRHRVTPRQLATWAADNPGRIAPLAVESGS